MMVVPPVRARVVLALLVLSSLTSCAALVRPNFETELSRLRPGEYTLDPRHSFLVFKISHLELSTYVGRFNEFQAELTFDPDDIDATSLQGLVELGSVDTGDAEVDSLLMEAGWFDTTQFPQGKFSTTNVTSTGTDQIAITGDLTLRGITRSVQLSGQFNGGADNLLTRRYTLGFSATGVFNRSDFGIDKLASLVGDEEQLEVFAEFLKN